MHETMMMIARQVTISRIFPTMLGERAQNRLHRRRRSRANAVESRATLAASTARLWAMEGISGSSARADRGRGKANGADVGDEAGWR